MGSNNVGKDLKLISAFASGGKKKDATLAEPTPLKIIGIGFGRTGTQSLMAAYTRLGLKSYHMKEGVAESGHLPLWAALARQQFAAADGDRSKCKYAPLTTSDGKISPELEAIIDAMAVEGFDATLDFPSCLIAPVLMVLLIAKNPGTFAFLPTFAGFSVERLATVAQVFYPSDFGLEREEAAGAVAGARAAEE